MTKKEKPDPEWVKSLEEGSPVSVVVAVRKNKRSSLPGIIQSVNNRIIKVEPIEEIHHRIFSILEFGRITGKGTGSFRERRWLEPMQETA